MASSVRVHVWTCMKLQKVLMCSVSVGGKRRVKLFKCACAWVVAEWWWRRRRRRGVRWGGVPKWWLVRKDDG